MKNKFEQKNIKNQEENMPPNETENFTVIDLKITQDPKGIMFEMVINYLGENRTVSGNVFNGQFEIWQHGMNGKFLPDAVQLEIKKIVLNLKSTPLSSSMPTKLTEAPWCPKCNSYHWPAVGHTAEVLN